MAANTKVYNKFNEVFTSAFAKAIITANKLNGLVEDRDTRIQNYIGIANAIAQSGLIQVDLMNDERLAKIIEEVNGCAEVANAEAEAKPQAAPVKKDPAIAKEGKDNKAAMKAAADKKMAEIKERKEAETKAEAPAKEEPTEFEKISEGNLQPAESAQNPAETQQAPAQETAAQPETAVNTSAVEAAAAPETEWNAETLAKYQAEITLVKQLIEAFGPEQSNKLVAQYSSGMYTSTDQLLPANIKGFTAYVLELQAQAQAAQNAA